MLHLDLERKPHSTVGSFYFVSSCKVESTDKTTRGRDDATTDACLDQSPGIFEIPHYFICLLLYCSSESGLAKG